MPWIMVDVESDGPCPGLFSMVSFGAVVVQPELLSTLHSGILKPLDGADHISEALAVSGVTREEQLKGEDPHQAMNMFGFWLRQVCGDSRPMFISDNNGFDWQFINWYFWKYTGGNPFGHSSTNLGSLYKGQVQSMFKNFKHLRKTKHTHDPVEDAKGNAEALLWMKKHGGLSISLE